MAKAPTLGEWQLELLRTIEHVVRLGHIRAGRKTLTAEDPLPADLRGALALIT